MADRIFNVLFLCQGNSARSIMAESILRRDGAGRFDAFSAGNHPKGEVNPFALAELNLAEYPTDGLRSKGWDEFMRPEAPVMDFVFTVCDLAAGEVCPVWPGRPLTAHWGIDDPALVGGSDLERRAAFARALRYMKTRISLFAALPIGSLDEMSLDSQLREIGLGEGSSQARSGAP